ncbi:MAG: hypothetical protein AMJ46_08005 [Latescibacteria bacterium DG_63]|jgi:hypothetical protein|nr:MAG: hypothetical protein AMJ46_08005 [Latescibacteria bacterium DG_63]
MSGVLNRLVLSGAGFGTIAIVLWMFVLFRVGREPARSHRGGPGSVFGSIILLLAALASSVASFGAYWLASSLSGYQPIDSARLVAIVECHPSIDPHFDMMLSYTPVTEEAVQERQTFGLKGDAWMVEGIVLEWHAWSRILGLRACHRTVRVAGQYGSDSLRTRGGSIADAAAKPETGTWSYELDEEHTSFWGLVRDLALWLPGGSARHVRSAAVVSDWNATFGVYVTRSGYSVARIDEGFIAWSA